MKWMRDEELEPFEDVDNLTIVVSRSELAGLANGLGECLEFVDSWEFETRLGIRPSDARLMIESIQTILHSTSRPG